MTTQEAEVDQQKTATLQALAERWETDARRRFVAGEQAEAAVPTLTERRGWEHGAMILFNCAQALRAAAQGLPLPESSSSPEETRRTLRPGA